MTQSASSVGQSTQWTAFRLENLTDQFQSKIWKLTFDLPGEKVNKLDRTVLGEFQSLLKALGDLGQTGQIDALVFCSGKKGNFIAGADIQLIQSAKSAEEATDLARLGQSLLNAWEDLPFPRIMAIQGTALGGGCEWSLASTAIVMSNDATTRIGLPEVLLGLIPGMGGCVRMPRKVGIATALDLILTGKTLNGEKAYRVGLADACLPQEDFLGNTFRWVQSNLKALQAGKRLAKPPKLGGMGGPIGGAMEKTGLGRSVIFKKAREGVISKTGGKYPGPLEAIETISEIGTGFGQRWSREQRDQMLRREAQGFGKMAATDVSKYLIQLFFLTERIKRETGLVGAKEVPTLEVQVAAVLGAGVMGGGVAQLFAEKDLAVRMKDLNWGALEIGTQAAAKLFKKQAQRKKITWRQQIQKLTRIAPVLDFAGFNQVDVVVEAVVEKMEVKKAVFKDLENYVRSDAILASNTSSLSITEMQSVLKYPERFVGMHFFNPVHRMPLIEVIRGEKTSDAAVSTVFQLSKKLGKTPVVVKDAPGFLVNRLLGPYLNESVYLLSEGVPLVYLDKVLVDFGMPMGPMELIDEVGVDVAEKVGHILHAAFGERMVPAPLNGKLVAAGRLGKKNKKGLYRYEGGEKLKKLEDAEVTSLLGLMPKSGAHTPEEIIDRCVLSMVNEAARCLSEKIVERASELDLAMIMGTGFPPFRGGLLRYADALTAKVIVDKLRPYQGRFGARFEPAPLLLELAQKSQTFYSRFES